LREELDCIVCYLKQVASIAKHVKLEEEAARNLVWGTFPLLPTLTPGITPAENCSLVLHRAHELLGETDPYDQAKKESNLAAMDLLPRLRARIAASPQPLYTACQVAAAGNIIDMGINPDYDIDASLREALANKFAKDDFAAFQMRLVSANRGMIIGDNSGEIAFDRLLVEQMRQAGAEVAYAVKGGPILNDATVEDAKQVGMAEVATIITNGNNFLGTVLDRCSPEFRRAFAEADLVLSKGQANYETLESVPEAGERTFFLLRVKCPIVARSLNAELGEMVLSQNRPCGTK